MNSVLTSNGVEDEMKRIHKFSYGISLGVEFNLIEIDQIYFVLNPKFILGSGTAVGPYTVTDPPFYDLSGTLPGTMVSFNQFYLGFGVGYHLW